MKTYVKVTKDTRHFGEGYLTVGKVYELDGISDYSGTGGSIYGYITDDGGRLIYENFLKSNHGYEYEFVEEPVSMGPESLNLGVGKTYNNKMGGTGFVLEENDGDFQVMHSSGAKIWHYNCGKSNISCKDFSDYDLVSEVKEEPNSMEPEEVCEAEKRGYKKVIITANVGGWPAGTVAWMDPSDCISGKAYNDDCSDSWFHTVGPNCEWFTPEEEEKEEDKSVLVDVYNIDKPWGELSPEEKGALLLHHHEGGAIECFQWDHEFWQHFRYPSFDGTSIYRAKKLEPVVETVVLGYSSVYGVEDIPDGTATHTITFKRIDGEPDCGSVTMEKL